MKLFLAILCLIHNRVVYSRIDSRIFNGEPSSFGEFPFIVSFRIGDYHNCAGSIITNWKILTAAHCISAGNDPATYRIYVGSNKISEGQWYEIASIKVHEKYIGPSDWWKNDLAVLTLKNPLVFSKNVKSINISRVSLKGGEPVTAIGWGLISQTPRVFPNLQQKLLARHFSYENCKRFWDVVPSQLCFWNGANSGRGICAGDSGGPLVYKNELVGVLSWTPSACTEGRPDVAVRLEHFSDWIVKNL